MGEEMERGHYSSEAVAEDLTLEQAIANLQCSDLGLRFYAAWWLGRFRIQEPEAIDLLISALNDSDDRTEDGGYPLRRNAARALGKIGAGRAVPELIACLACSDYYVRESAARSLGELGDAQAIPALLGLLEGGVEAAKFVDGKPHLVQPYDAVLEALGELGAQDCEPIAREFLGHFSERVQYSAARALYQLTGEDEYGQNLIQALSGPELQLRRSALMDLAATDYLPAAAAIAETLAENSMKLIALRGLLANHVGDTTPEIEGDRQLTLSDDVISVLALMDGLL